MGDRGPRGRERGSATVLVLAVAAVTLVASGPAIVVAYAATVRARAMTAADLAALAAADAPRSSSGRCAEAALVAVANGAQLSGCSVTTTPAGAVVTVTAAVPVGRLVAADSPRAVVATARAGPEVSDQGGGP